jgi:UDP-N-acetylglucosamine 2-epimerase (non-hydrolysing)
VRPNTERPVTVEEGTNVLFSGTIDALEPAVREQLSRPRAQHQVPEYWDGQAAERIVAVFQQLAHV